ncbi:integumentary mucin A.1-like, partial [Hyalella azteca]|uniref:Integumentary mucin A.1-like n=1 Tax=Hyalella azteca TaxID=294128 RepID=A0A8B7NAT4_HYAAZ
MASHSRSSSHFPPLSSNVISPSSNLSPLADLVMRYNQQPPQPETLTTTRLPAQPVSSTTTQASAQPVTTTRLPAPPETSTITRAPAQPMTLTTTRLPAPPETSTTTRVPAQPETSTSSQRAINRRPTSTSLAGGAVSHSGSSDALLDLTDENLTLQLLSPAA